jgi:hypothetical protein
VRIALWLQSLACALRCWPGAAALEFKLPAFIETSFSAAVGLDLLRLDVKLPTLGREEMQVCWLTCPFHVPLAGACGHLVSFPTARYNCAGHI